MHRSLSPAQTRPAVVKSVPFLLMHLAPLGLLWTGVRAIDWVVCFALYFVRMFFITGVFHRYFAHRSYEMGRVMQFLMALGGGTAAQKGALWWASHHRMHHKFSDLPTDIHSPKDGFWWSHMGWIMSTAHDDTEWKWIRDFAKYPELVWLNKYHLVPPVLLGFAVYLVGGASMLFCGFFLSTVLLYHGTFTINSLCHVFGRRRFVTTDTSRNSLILALITLGEGWHNNHHYYQSATNQGFYWWEIDISYYILKALSWVGLVHGIRNPPPEALTSNRVTDHYDVGMAPNVVHAAVARSVAPGGE
jgi:stearoyl-CoA desaturase (Delta-9 desaturase)